MGGDQIGHDVQAGGWHTIRNFVGSQFQAGVFGRNFLLEAFGALVQ